MTRKCLTHAYHSCHISSFCLLRVRLYVEQFIVQSYNFIAPVSPLPQCVMSECHSLYLQNILNPLYRNGGNCMDGFESDFTCVQLAVHHHLLIFIIAMVFISIPVTTLRGRGTWPRWQRRRWGTWAVPTQDPQRFLHHLQPYRKAKVRN